MGKKHEVRSMFDSIAWRYDFLNHFLSFGTDFFWRKKAIAEISKRIQPDHILDVATGTCDLALAAMKLKPELITGVDISQRMLEEGRKKIHRKHLEHKINLMVAESENLPFEDSVYDVCMVAFGVRNFEDPLKGLTEMNRVMKPGGVIMVLEFSKPARFPFKTIYYFYFKRVLPLFGKIFSKSRGAYNYLPDSVMSFAEGDSFMEMLDSAGFADLGHRRLTGGVATIYTGAKTRA
jgi:demethylmenaquinone methyltransferase/2-methoxy-6-polyprenyl-1,4-benzoquinol methylase